jgi:hypothetical protein
MKVHATLLSLGWASHTQEGINVAIYQVDKFA